MLIRFLALILAACGTLRAADDVREVACVGDSITQGVGVAAPDRESYPAQLQDLLGEGYTVRNFGSSGATLLREGNNPFRKTRAFRDACASKSDIVVIALGTNDSKTINWDGREEEFRRDYRELIEQFRAARRNVRIFVCLPPPAFQQVHDIREHILVRQRDILRDLAKKDRLPVIDLFSPLRDHPAWLPDGVHPDAAGARAIAETVAAAITRSGSH